MRYTRTPAAVVVLLALVLLAFGSSCHVVEETRRDSFAGAASGVAAAPEPLSVDAMSARIVAALAPSPGERALLRYEPTVLGGLAFQLAGDLTEAGVSIGLVPYGPVDEFEEQLQNADIYVWLPAKLQVPHGADEQRALGRWLDAGRGRQVHFHWGTGTVAIDGLPGAHSAAYDDVYARALDIDYAALDRAQDAAIELLRSGTVRVTTPAGTDLGFTVGDRPFNKQNGDASKRRMATAKTRIDREIELPAGVVRVAPLEQSVRGTIVVPRARFGDGVATDLELGIEAGVVTSVEATTGAALVEAAMAATPALRHFRELGVGFNKALVVPDGHPFLPYYGYGAGVVRLSLGNNQELGGAVDASPGARWLFFPDATVAVGDTVLVDRGRLIARGR